jgi:hypothetical protein
MPLALTGARHELLTPYDPRQQPGRPPRIYPLHLMAPGDWFAIDNCSPHRAASIRSAVTNFRKQGHSDQRFAVRYEDSLGPATVVCARIA